MLISSRSMGRSQAASRMRNKKPLLLQRRSASHRKSPLQSQRSGHGKTSAPRSSGARDEVALRPLEYRRFLFGSIKKKGDGAIKEMKSPGVAPREPPRAPQAQASRWVPRSSIVLYFRTTTEASTRVICGGMRIEDRHQDRKPV